MVILENIDIDKAILQNIDIDKISNRFKFGISNRAMMYTTTWFLTLSTNCRVRLATLLSISPTWEKGQLWTFSDVSDDEYYEGTIVMMMMMVMTTRNPLDPWWGHRCKWDPSKSLEGGRSCPRAHLNFQVSVFGSEKERFVLQPMDLDKLLKILIKPVKRSPSVPRSLLPSQTISISNSFARLS